MLYRAVASGDVDEVSRLLASTPEAVAYQNDKGETCLHAACEYHVENYTHHDAAIPLLVAAGCDIDKRSTDHGTTALMAACYYGHSSCVEQLLRLGADANLQVRCARGVHRCNARAWRHGRRAPHAVWLTRRRVCGVPRAEFSRREGNGFCHSQNGRHCGSHQVSHAAVGCHSTKNGVTGNASRTGGLGTVVVCA